MGEQHAYNLAIENMLYSLGHACSLQLASLGPCCFAHGNTLLCCCNPLPPDESTGQHLLFGANVAAAAAPPNRGPMESPTACVLRQTMDTLRQPWDWSRMGHTHVCCGIWCVLDWIGPDRTGLDWAGLEWTGVEFIWVGLCLVVFGWIELDLSGLDGIGWGQACKHLCKIYKEAKMHMAARG